MSFCSVQHGDAADADRFIARIIGLRARYGHRFALYDVSLDLRPQETVAVIGPNGSGKSTLLRVIAGFLEAAAGEIQFQGRVITHLSAYERARLGIGYFMQGGRIFPSLTVEENIEMAAALLPKAAREENINTVLSLFPHLIGQSRVRGGLLSGGERQALALALVLIRRPRLLLLDEPSAGLAPAVTRHLLDKLREINRQWNLSVLLVEQNIEEALSVSHRVVALVNGRQVNLDAETPASLLSSRRLEEVFFGDMFA
jgi:branched-chain amino acid transport system ATP-binding protein